jgi:hypothetical protein
MKAVFCGVEPEVRRWAPCEGGLSPPDEQRLGSVERMIQRKPHPSNRKADICICAWSSRPAQPPYQYRVARRSNQIINKNLFLTSRDHNGMPYTQFYNSKFTTTHPVTSTLSNRIRFRASSFCSLRHRYDQIDISRDPLRDSVQSQQNDKQVVRVIQRVRIQGQLSSSE